MALSRLADTEDVRQAKSKPRRCAAGVIVIPGTVRIGTGPTKIVLRAGHVMIQKSGRAGNADAASSQPIPIRRIDDHAHAGWPPLTGAPPLSFAYRPPKPHRLHFAVTADATFEMSFDLITLVIRTNCEAAHDDDIVIITGPTSPPQRRRGSGDEDARRGQPRVELAIEGTDHFSNASFPDLLFRNREDGAGPSSFSIDMSKDQQRQRRRRRRQRVRSAMLSSWHVSCDIAVKSQSSLTIDYGGTDGAEVDGRDVVGRDNDPSVGVHVDGVSLGRCGATSVVSLTNDFLVSPMDSSAEHQGPSDQYSVRVPRCWLTEDGSGAADFAQRHPHQGAATTTALSARLRVLDVQEAWQAPSDLASSPLARVTVTLAATDLEIEPNPRPAAPEPSDPIRSRLSSTDNATNDIPSNLHTNGFTVPRIEQNDQKVALSLGDHEVQRQCLWRRPRTGSGHGCSKRAWGAEGESGFANGVLQGDASCGVDSKQAGEARGPEVDVNRWFEQERLESNRILALHVFLWTVLVVYLVWDAWRSSRRKRRLQQQRSTAQGRPVNVPHLRGPSAGRRAFDDDDDTAATTPESPSSANNDEGSSSSNVRAIATSTDPTRGVVNVFHQAHDDTTEPGNLSPVSELKARHLLRIQAKRREKSLRGASASTTETTPPLTPLPGVPLRSAAVVTPVRSAIEAHNVQVHHDGGLQRPTLPPPLPSLSEVSDVRAASSDANSVRISTTMAAAVTPSSSQDIGAAPRRAASSSIFGEAIEAAAAARRSTHRRADSGTDGEVAPPHTSGDGTADGGSDFNTPVPTVTRIETSTVASKPKARRSLRPSRPCDSSQPRDSVLDAFWDLGD